MTHAASPGDPRANCAPSAAQSVRVVRTAEELEVVRHFEVPLREVSAGALSRNSIETIAWKPDGSEVAALSGPLVLFVPADRDKPMRTLNRLPDINTVSLNKAARNSLTTKTAS